MAGKKRVPPPPVRREKPVVVRVEDDEPRQSKKSRASVEAIDVADVQFEGIASDTDVKLRRRLAEAAVAFERERFAEAQKLLSSIDRLAPGTPEVLELRGLAAYRLGKWKVALKDLESFAAATGSVEQHPVMADCFRALRRWDKVEDLWYELGESSPAAELVEEGRIVYAGSLADQGRPTDGIRVLEKAPRAPKKPKMHHLRRWYALADLYERVGDLARARRLFGEVSQLDPNFGDAGQRARNLR